MKTTKKQIEQVFKSEILPTIPATDRPMRQMTWNDFCDSLHPKFIDK